MGARGVEVLGNGVGLVVVAIPVMWFLASAKIRLADQIGSHALRAVNDNLRLADHQPNLTLGAR